MTPSQNDLAAFLRARYTAARNAEEGRRTIRGHLDFQWEHRLDFDDEYVLINGHRRMAANDFWGQYGEPNPDPVVLADLDAKLAIVSMYEAAALSVEAAEGTILAGGTKVNCRAYGNVLRELATVYADHPDYRSEWAPEPAE